MKHLKKIYADFLSLLKQKDQISVVISCMLVIHAMTLFLFAHFKIEIMVLIYAFSLITYSASFLKSIRSDYGLLLKIFYAEIIFRTFAATICLGWDAGFPLFIFALLPFTYYISYLATLKDSSKINTRLYSAVSILAFWSVRLYSYFKEPLYTAHGNQMLSVFYFFNTSITMILILFCLSVFSTKIMHSENSLKAHNSRLSSLAITDSLTGFYNRRFMVDHLKHSILRAKQTGYRFSLLLCDIDDFKLINDTYGHNCGDKVIQQMSEVMQRNVRESDSICRWGGEEILLLLPGCSDADAARLAEKIRFEINQEPVLYQGNQVSFSMTFGVQSYEPCTDYLELIRKVDIKLYQGKNRGKNCVVL